MSKNTMKHTVYLYSVNSEDGSQRYACSDTVGMEHQGWILISINEIDIEIPEDALDVAYSKKMKSLLVHQEELSKKSAENDQAIEALNQVGNE